ncbi:hypothetical protein IU450_36105 [Nocardia abscessus]|nr:hypothetical protein [Nocardia abscessus]
MLAQQRRLVYVEHWLAGNAVTVLPGMSVDDSDIRPGARYWHSDCGEGFAVALSAGGGLGTTAHPHEGSEFDAAHRFLIDRRAAARIHIRGFGHCREDHIQITTYDKRGVGVHRALYFDDPPPHDLARQDASLLEMLAAHGDWSARALAEFAARIRQASQPAVSLPTLIPATTVVS